MHRKPDDVQQLSPRLSYWSAVLVTSQLPALISMLGANLGPAGVSESAFDEHLTGFRHIASISVWKPPGFIKSRLPELIENRRALTVSVNPSHQGVNWNCFFCVPFFFHCRWLRHLTEMKKKTLYTTKQFFPPLNDFPEKHSLSFKGKHAFIQPLDIISKPFSRKWLLQFSNNKNHTDNLEISKSHLSNMIH